MTKGTHLNQPATRTVFFGCIATNTFYRHRCPRMYAHVIIHADTAQD
jgi:hypothetical protein